MRQKFAEYLEMYENNKIDLIVSNFITKYNNGLNSLYGITAKHIKLSFDEFIDQLSLELKNSCSRYLDSYDNIDEIDSYLFYAANSFVKEKEVRTISKVTEYLCPGCLFLGRNNTIDLSGNTLSCEKCNQSYNTSIDPKNQNFFKIFKHHNKRGHKCPDCNRFIPHPIYVGTNIITCPYLDCCFIGDISKLKKMNHPSAKVIPIIDDNSSVIENNQIHEVVSHQIDLNNSELLNKIIDSQSASVPYHGSQFTLVHKVSAYQAFKNLLNKFPMEMVDYLVHQSRSGGFQSKIFQEYVRLLEESFPFCYKKEKKVYRVNSLLDPNLNIFDGISVFEALVSDKLEIKNNTKEFYIGGRKAAYAKPFYIGKLLNIIDKNTKQPLINNVKNYSFSKINMTGIASGTEVIVTHLRIPPHYQMGGMTYINRVRENIVREALTVLKHV